MKSVNIAGKCETITNDTVNPSINILGICVVVAAAAYDLFAVASWRACRYQSSATGF
jgi:hypothetical protein